MAYFLRLGSRRIYQRHWYQHHRHSVGNYQLGISDSVRRSPNKWNTLRLIGVRYFKVITLSLSLYSRGLTLFHSLIIRVCENPTHRRPLSQPMGWVLG